MYRRVGIFSSSSLLFYGGGEVTVIQLANALYEMGYEVTVYSDSNYKGVARHTMSEVGNKLKCKHELISYSHHKAPLKPSFLHQNLPPARAFLENDVNLVLLYRVPSRKYCKSEFESTKAKIILMMHGLIFDKKISRSTRVWLYQHYVRLAFRFISNMVSNNHTFFQLFSDEDKLFLSRHGIKKEKSFVIPCGVDFSRYTVARNDDFFRIIFIGRLYSVQKGIPLLLEISEKLLSLNHKEIEFTVVGSGPDMEKVKLFSIEHPQLSVRGFISEDEKVSELANSNLMIVTSNIEPFSIATIEGLAAGLPVVSTPVTGPVSILNSAAGLGRIASFHSREFVTSILLYYKKWLVDKETYYQEKKSRRRVSQNLFDLSKMAGSYASMIDKVLSE